MYIKEPLPWVPPVIAVSALAENERCFVFLHSAELREHSGRYSYLALYPQEVVSGKHFSLMVTKLCHHCHALENAWFGYFGYELLHDIETIAEEQKNYITLPDLWFAQFKLILVFDHTEKTIMAYREENTRMPSWPSDFIPTSTLPQVESLTSPMPREEYIHIVKETLEAIRRGDFYQANITRKFTGTFTKAADPLSIFHRLIEASPSVFSAIIRMDNVCVISSSPESFLKIDSNGRMESSPIKGTSPRFSDPKCDEESRGYLANSEKERAENLMIVDLMRNDFSRSCVAGSVQVERLFDIASYSTLHHMASTITGQKRDDVSTLEAVRNCFPPGSMTGAPKIKAMQWCMEHEKIRRSVYSGALGWLGGDGSCDLSVVIRTLVIEGNRFEFQVGGGITSGSDPEKEWQETIIKARGIMAALGIDIKKLENL